MKIQHIHSEDIPHSAHQHTGFAKRTTERQMNGNFETRTRSLLLGEGEALRDVLPVDDLPDALHVVGTHVLVLWCKTYNMENTGKKRGYERNEGN